MASNLRPLYDAPLVAPDFFAVDEDAATTTVVRVPAPTRVCPNLVHVATLQLLGFQSQQAKAALPVSLQDDGE